MKTGTHFPVSLVALLQVLERVQGVVDMDTLVERLEVDLCRLVIQKGTVVLVLLTDSHFDRSVQRCLAECCIAGC